MEGDSQQSIGIPFYLNDYLELQDWSVRAICENKSDTIPMKLLTILIRLQIDSDSWIYQVNNFGKRLYRVAGSEDKIKTLAHKMRVKWLNGQGGRSPFPERVSFF